MLWGDQPHAPLWCRLKHSHDQRFLSPFAVSMHPSASPSTIPSSSPSPTRSIPGHPPPHTSAQLSCHPQDPSHHSSPSHPHTAYYTIARVITGQVCSDVQTVPTAGSVKSTSHLILRTQKLARQKHEVWFYYSQCSVYYLCMCGM